MEQHFEKQMLPAEHRGNSGWAQMTFKNCRKQSLKEEEGLISRQTEELVLRDKGICLLKF